MTSEQHKRLLRGDRWRGVRKYVIRRDDNRCQACRERFSVREMDAHHDPPVGPETTVAQFYDPKNVQALCRSCHSLETNRDKRGPPVLVNGKVNPAFLAWKRGARASCP